MKNAITVVDQELIDFIDEQIELGHYDRFVGEINQMTKDLVEINAELTKREQKFKNKLGLCANHLLPLLGVDDIEDEEDKSTIHDKANEFLIEIDKILKD